MATTKNPRRASQTPTVQEGALAYTLNRALDLLERVMDSNDLKPGRLPHDILEILTVNGRDVREEEK